MKKDVTELTKSMMDVMRKAFNLNQKLGDQYVVEYRLVSDDSILGYHKSTFCQLTDDKLSAKRYSGDNPFSQIAIISKNLNSVLNTTEEDDDFLAKLRAEVKQKHFKGLNEGDIYLAPVYLDPSVEAQEIEFTEVWT